MSPYLGFYNGLACARMVCPGRAALTHW